MANAWEEIKELTIKILTINQNVTTITICAYSAESNVASNHLAMFQIVTLDSNRSRLFQ